MGIINLQEVEVLNGVIMWRVKRQARGHPFGLSPYAILHWGQIWIMDNKMETTI